MHRNKERRSALSAEKRAHRAGFKAARNLPEGEPSSLALNGWWCKYRQSRPNKVISWRDYFSEVKSFLRGYSRASGIKTPDWILLPTEKKVAVVATVMNESAASPLLMRQLNRLPLEEKIVVINSSSDDSCSAARCAGATVIHYPDPLGRDVGRAVGAKWVQSEIVIFLEGNIFVKAEQLVPFVYSVHCGSDVALNDIKPFLGPIRKWDNVTLMKEFLNRCSDRQDLSANSLAVVPYAMSRKALETIGVRHMAVPPKAHIIALQSGLKVTAPASVNVGNAGAKSPVSERIMGDHFEALQLLRLKKGPRMGFADSIRKREVFYESQKAKMDEIQACRARSMS